MVAIPNSLRARDATFSSIDCRSLLVGVSVCSVGADVDGGKPVPIMYMVSSSMKAYCSVPSVSQVLIVGPVQCALFVDVAVVSMASSKMSSVVFVAVLVGENWFTCSPRSVFGGLVNK